MKVKPWSSILLAFSLVVVALPAGAEWRQPFEPEDLARQADLDRAGLDPCGCLRALRVCLITAAASLDGCLSDAPNPTRETLCYLKFELDVLLCLEQAGVCQLTCLP